MDNRDSELKSLITELINQYMQERYFYIQPMSGVLLKENLTRPEKHVDGGITTGGISMPVMLGDYVNNALLPGNDNIGGAEKKKAKKKPKKKRVPSAKQKKLYAKARLVKTAAGGSMKWCECMKEAKKLLEEEHDEQSD